MDHCTPVYLHRCNAPIHPYIAQFTVQVRRPGVVALQNVNNPRQYIKPDNDKLESGGGGRKSELKVEEHGELQL